MPLAIADTTSRDLWQKCAAAYETVITYGKVSVRIKVGVVFLLSRHTVLVQHSF